MKMFGPASFTFVVCFAIIAVVYAQNMDHRAHGTGGQEEYEIKLYISGGTTSWKISNWKTNTTVDDIVKSINANLGAGPVSQLPDTTGYRGYEVGHIVNGIKLHTWYLPRCKKPALETALIEHTATNRATTNQYIYIIKGALSSCPPSS